MDGVGNWFTQLAETSWSLRDGAGTRDRTGDTSLEGWGFTAKLCPQNPPVSHCLYYLRCFHDTHPNFFLLKIAKSFGIVLT